MAEGEYWVIRNDMQKAAAMGHMACIQPSESAPMAIKVEPYKKNRSDLQNRFLNGYIYKEIADQLGAAGIVIPCDDGTEHPYTRDILHDIFRRKFLKKGELTAKGKTLELYYSTADLNTKQFSEYVEQVRDFVYQFWHIGISEPVRGYWATIVDELK